MNHSKYLTELQRRLCAEEIDARQNGEDSVSVYSQGRETLRISGDGNLFAVEGAGEEAEALAEKTATIVRTVCAYIAVLKETVPFAGHLIRISHRVPNSLLKMNPTL